MKKLISLMVALLVCLSLVVPAAAVENEFVPSISYKGSFVVISAETDGEDVSDCVVITSIKDAKDKKTDISQDDRDLLLEIYDKLSNGEMPLPLDGDYVIRELVDISFKYDDCREDETHPDKDGMLKKPGVTLTVTADLDIGGAADLKVFSYVNGEWVPAKVVKINGDGTVTLELEDICPVVFCVDKGYSAGLPDTGDVFGRNLTMWIVLLAVFAAAIVVLLINRRKFVR